MTIAPEATIADVAVSTAGTVAVSGSRQPVLATRYFGMVSAKSAAHVMAAAAMWLIVLAVITVV
jgi:hypothetical protein